MAIINAMPPQTLSRADLVRAIVLFLVLLVISALMLVIIFLRSVWVASCGGRSCDIGLGTFASTLSVIVGLVTPVLAGITLFAFHREIKKVGSAARIGDIELGLPCRVA